MIYLASQSPRRKQLMELTGREFIVKPSDVEEIVPADFTPKQTVEYLSIIKADALYNEIEDSDIIIGADTIVVFENEIFGKPSDEKDAFRMLAKMSGNTHEVITGVTVIKKSGNEKIQNTFSSITQVKFYSLSHDEINRYIETKEYKDKAGAYGIQERGGLFVEKINGDFFNVVGLPVAQLEKVLKEIK